jgi:hypothetical protein
MLLIPLIFHAPDVQPVWFLKMRCSSAFDAQTKALTTMQQIKHIAVFALDHAL